MACRRRKQQHQQPQQQEQPAGGSAGDEEQPAAQQVASTPTAPGARRAPFEQLRFGARYGGRSGRGRRSAEEDNGEDVPGVSAAPMPSHLLLHPLPRPPRQSRRAYFKVIPGKSRTSLFVQFSGERGLWACGRAGASNGATRRSGYIL